MSKIGLILACDHYPVVSSDATQVDAQLRFWLAANGTTFDEIEVYAAYDGALPNHGASCDAWIISGATYPTLGQNFAIGQFLCAAASLGRRIYAINHAEHTVHATLGAIDAPAPATPSAMRVIRNPFRSFHSGETLHRFNPSTRQVEALPRPDAICARRRFGAWLVAG